jgi:hypothetical protein
MAKIKGLGLLVCLLMAANAWAVPFADDFDRPNGNVGNGWTILRDGTVDSTIVDGEVLVSGTTSASAWVRCGISRVVVGETKFSCDFKNDDVFNFHMQITLGDTTWSQAYLEVYAWAGGPLQYASSPDGSWPAAGWVTFSGADAQTTAGQYNNLMMELGEGGVVTVTLNGKLAGTVTNPGLTQIGSVTFASDADANTKGSVHIDNVRIGTMIAGAAKDPRPAVDAADVPFDVVFGWTPGEYAATHDVYLGTSMLDVAGATAGDPKGVLVSQGQADAGYAPQSPLEYGQTYYWRVDEVNAAPDNTVIAGGVWSFTVEPYVYPITNITATASSEATGAVAQNTVNGSGLNADDQHSTEMTQMWMSAGSLPSWIQYEFDAVYKLDEMWVWNSNQLIESVIGFGAKDVTIETSVDGAAWTQLEGVPEFARASGSPAYTASTTVDFGGAMAKYVRLTIDANWSAMAPQTSLSEVRFYYLPVQARGPRPADAATDVAVDTDLSWRQGRDAESHEVYLGTDPSVLAQVGAPTEHAFTPASLDFGTTYYWKVNEVAADGSHEGDVWNFTTQEFVIAEDFESYDDEDNRIYLSWIDGVTTEASGSQVGYDESPFAEQSIVHSLSQSMPFMYDNTESPYVSEAEREFESAQNWTGNGASEVCLWTRGYPAPTPVAVTETGGKMSLTGSGADIWETSDQFTYAYKTLTGDGSIIARVVSNGVGSNVWTKGGVMIRDSANGGSMHAMMVMTGDSTAGNGASFQYRAATNGTSGNADSTVGVKPPYWVKIERAGANFTGYHSADGKTWSTVGTTIIEMADPVLIGLAVTSHAAGEDRTFEFDGITATGTISGSWQGAVINAAQYNDPAAMYLTITDSAGKSATVTSETAALTADWTRWAIPMSDFAGVNFAKVQNVIIGIGTKGATAPGGKGIVFIDDIGYGRSAQ